MFEVESPGSLILGLLTGLCFGFLLQKGRVSKYQVILGQLMLKDWTVFKIMFMAIGSGAIGVYFLVDNGVTHLDIWPFQLAAMLLGAALFGAGLAIIGYCPGTGLAATGEGSRDAVVGVLGMLAGAGVFVFSFNALEPVALALGDFGRITIPALIGSSPWPVIAALAVFITIALWVMNLAERKRADLPPGIRKILARDG
jgi:uncharacterized protein